MLKPLRAIMELRTLVPQDIPSIWKINQEGLPGTGDVTEEEVTELMSLSEISLGIFDADKLLGFVLCLLPKTSYGSLNYAWFNERYSDFIYVDRIAVSQNERNKNIGTQLYHEVINYSQQHNCPIAAEVSLNPPNPGSMRFHERHAFVEVGVLHHETKSVVMMIRD